MRIFKWDPSFCPSRESLTAPIWIRIEGPLFDSIWVGFEDDILKKPLEGFWVKVFYDEIPPFCTSCSHIGHALEGCKIKKRDVLNDVSEQIDGVRDKGHLGQE
ncbi:hypothetical protein LIER_09947 [Lithospermum erythrorhizon]|uniref:DUF4283 domain-containing protein n=1 Tax=Lithospermum erythrorhizon TaxID=34254 RepID=A0AAV3PMG6_LITER